MLKINKSILIICLVLLFLIIGQISASDTDSIEINDTDMNDLILNQATNEISDDSNIKFPKSNLVDKIDDEIVYGIIDEKKKDTSGVVMANDNYRCGPASLATVLNKNGFNLSLNEVSQHTNTSLDGTTMQSLIDAAKHYNFSAYGVEIATENLKENHIVHLNLTEGNIKLTIDEFNSCFSRKAIVLSNNSPIDLKDQLISNQISILNRNQCIKISGKGLKKKIVGYRTVWKYGFVQRYGWVLRPKVVGGHVTFSQWVYVKGNRPVWGKYKVKEPIYKYYFVSDDKLTSAKIKR